MRQKKLVLPPRVFVCPATNKPCLLGATLLIRPPEMKVESFLDDDQTDAVKAAAVEEAARHG